jgi:anti-sigma regulatory factor (Ser/Thr protein kinase)
MSFRHASGLFDSDEEFLRIVLPFLAEGVDAGEPVAVALTADNENLVREVLGDRVTYIDAHTQYDRPAGTIRRSRELFGEHVAAGATRIRMAGDVPADRVSGAWDWWARYEAAVNDLYNEFPVWAICVYDTRTTSEPVLAEVRRTHPYVALADGHTANPAFENPRTFLEQRRSGWRNPMELTPVTIELRDPDAAAVRHAIRTVAADLTPDELNGLLLGASEVLTNALLYGRPPVTVQVWATPRRVVLVVRDQGPGPADPYVGLRPVPGAPVGGMGLWLAHQLCAYVDMAREPDGFTVRLVAGDPG